MPFHVGHALCLDKLAEECDVGYLIFFINGNEEEDAQKECGYPEYLSWEERYKTVREYIFNKNYKNIKMAIVDCIQLRLPDGSEDWDGETPFVREICGDRIDAVYSSEIRYDDYFKRAYPEAYHRLVDPPRIIYPISGTKCREMDEKERKEWII